MRPILGFLSLGKEGKEKYHYCQGGVNMWLGKVHGIKLAEVTPARVQQWKQSFLTKAGSDPLAW